jgi:hypothetical protein
MFARIGVGAVLNISETPGKLPCLIPVGAVLGISFANGSPTKATVIAAALTAVTIELPDKTVWRMTPSERHAVAASR